MGVNVAAHTRHVFLGSAPPEMNRYQGGGVSVPALTNQEGLCDLSCCTARQRKW